MCGIIGIYNNKAEVINYIYDGLIQLQHRGQDAAGICTMDNSKMHLHKNLGLVTEVFKKSSSRVSLTGRTGIGHVRYPTAGSNDLNDSQPLYTANPVNITLAHNGTLTNSNKLRTQLLKTNFCQFNTSSDSEVLLNLFAYELYKTNYRKLGERHIFKALSQVYEKCHGGFAVVMLISGIGIVAFRDPNGIRPLSIGKRGNSYIIASESSVLSALDYKFIKDTYDWDRIIITLRWTNFGNR